MCERVLRTLCPRIDIPHAPLTFAHGRSSPSLLLAARIDTQNRLLMGRNVVLLLDTLYVHVVCYGIVPNYRLQLPMPMERVASVRQRNVLSFRQKIAQTLLVFVPLLYFYIDSAEGCDYLCCASDSEYGVVDDPAGELVPRYLADRAILCTLAALPCLYYIIASPASALRDVREAKWLQSRMQQGGHQHGKG